jgi:ATP-binding cassette subfamily B protein
MVIVFLAGGYQVIAGTMSLGAFVAFMAYQGRMMAPVQNVMTLYTNLSTLKVATKRVMELMDVKADVESDGCLPPPEGDIEFRQVGFQHDREVILENASFVIPAGTFCVVLGSSGAGKSSIADLLVRIYDPNSGAVLLGGLDLRRLSLGELRRSVALVEQDTFLFNGTIADNIRYGGEARGAERQAQFLTLPPETVVGDRGLALSGGEKQTIGIARALARDPRVLILDEATSAMDPALESRVLDELRRTMAGRTIILITHRTYLARLADLVLQVEDGRVLSEACSKSL